MTIGLIAGFTTTVVAEEEEETTVDIEVDDTVQLDVKPDALEYTDTALDPGEQRLESDEGFEHIDIENIGSDRLDLIYAESTLHDDEPFGTVAGSQEPVHNTGNLVLMSTQTADEDNYRVATDGGLEVRNDMRYLNRIEYAEDQYPEYIQVHDPDAGDNLDVDIDVGVSDSETIDSEINNIEVGRFRVGEVNYFFAVVETDASGASTDTFLLVGNTPETPTDLGTFDFTSENENEFTVVGLDEDQGANLDGYDAGFSLASFNPDDYDSNEPVLDGNSGIEYSSSLTEGEVEDREYNLWWDDTEGILARVGFNVNFELPNGEDTDGVIDTSGQTYILDAGGTEDNALQPGENFPVDFGVQLPNGIDHESIEEGRVTFNAQAYTDSG